MRTAILLIALVTSLATASPGTGATQTVTIHGVHPRMTRLEILRVLGRPSRIVYGWNRAMWLHYPEVDVEFDESGGVTQIRGTEVELDGRVVARAPGDVKDVPRALGQPSGQRSLEVIWAQRRLICIENWQRRGVVKEFLLLPRLNFVNLGGVRVLCYPDRAGSGLMLDLVAPGMTVQNVAEVLGESSEVRPGVRVYCDGKTTVTYSSTGYAVEVEGACLLVYPQEQARQIHGRDVWFGGCDTHSELVHVGVKSEDLAKVWELQLQTRAGNTITFPLVPHVAVEIRDGLVSNIRFSHHDAALEQELSHASH